MENPSDAIMDRISQLEKRTDQHNKILAKVQGIIDNIITLIQRIL